MDISFTYFTHQQIHSGNYVDVRIYDLTADHVRPEHYLKLAIRTYQKCS